MWALDWLFTISRALANSGRGNPYTGQKGPPCQNFRKQKIKDTVNTFYELRDSLGVKSHGFLSQLCQ